MSLWAVDPFLLSPKPSKPRQKNLSKTVDHNSRHAIVVPDRPSVPSQGQDDQFAGDANVDGGAYIGDELYFSGGHTPVVVVQSTPSLEQHQRQEYRCTSAPENTAPVMKKPLRGLQSLLDSLMETARNVTMDERAEAARNARRTRPSALRAANDSGPSSERIECFSDPFVEVSVSMRARPFPGPARMTSESQAIVLVANTPPSGSPDD